MTQEHKELLLKDLCARLPYHTRVKVWLKDGTTEEGALDLEHNYGDVLRDAFYYNKIVEVKPYLFPLSSMTDKQAKEIQEITGNPDYACIIRKTDGLELWLDSTDTDPTIWLDAIFEVQDYLNKNHFDYRNLINKNLAIDCTNLNIY